MENVEDVFLIHINVLLLKFQRMKMFMKPIFSLSVETDSLFSLNRMNQV